MKSITVGMLRHLMTLQSPGAASANSDGGFTQTYSSLTPATEWASIAPATARDLERVTAGTVMSTATHLVTMRYRSDVTTQTRLVFNGRYFSVTGLINPDERNRELILTCVEVVA